MKQDIILCGVGGQGILSITFVIDSAALKQGLSFKQAEVHGMAQRGGAVQSHLRISDSPIFSDLIPKGEADMILSVEPLESLRYFDYLSPEGIVISSRNPFVNIPDYPDLQGILEQIQELSRHVLIDSETLAKEVGSSKSVNMILLGAASPFIQLETEYLVEHIRVLFQRHGEKVVDINLEAFRMGREAALKNRE